MVQRQHRRWQQWAVAETAAVARGDPAEHPCSPQTSRAAAPVGPGRGCRSERISQTRAESEATPSRPARELFRARGESPPAPSARYPQPVAPALQVFVAPVSLASWRRSMIGTTPTRPKSTHRQRRGKALVQDVNSRQPSNRHTPYAPECWAQMSLSRRPSHPRMPLPRCPSLGSSELLGVSWTSQDERGHRPVTARLSGGLLAHA